MQKLIQHLSQLVSRLIADMYLICVLTRFYPKACTQLLARFKSECNFLLSVICKSDLRSIALTVLFFIPGIFMQTQSSNKLTDHVCYDLMYWKEFCSLAMETK